MDAYKAEVLRYLGYRGQALPPEIDAMLEVCMLDTRKAAVTRHVRSNFDISFEDEGVRLVGTGIILRGQSIRKHLSGCSKAVLLAATLGLETDSLIRRYEVSDVTRALTLDACATWHVEWYCDEIEDEIKREAGENGFGITSRFSPGYGDFPLDIQPKLLAALNAERRIGLTCTERFIMLPRKSVTALIGMGVDVKDRESGCKACAMKDKCAAAKGTKACEYTGIS